MSNKAKDPIGIFDSGIGGLTVAHAVKKLLPQESLIYFGDTAHLPYGDKSTAAIQSYAVKICDVLLQQHCKLILIACNSASAAAFELVREYVGSKAKVMSVIEPVVDFVRENFAESCVGLIGTKQTVQSNVFLKKIDHLNENIDFRSLATPLLVPMIEEGFFKNEVSQQIVDTYLGHEALKDIKALILGCTHYPLIKKEIDTYYHGKVQIIDSSEITAKALRAYLEFNNLLNSTGEAKDRFMVSDFTPSFEHSTALFFGKEIQLEKYPLWE